MSGIVGSCHAEPVAVFGICFFQIFTGSSCFFLHVVAFVNIAVHLQTEFASRTGHKLPQSGCAGGRLGKRIKGAFYYGKIFEIIRYAVCSQYRLYDGKVAVCPFYGEHCGGVHIGERHQLAVHALAVVVTQKVYVLSGKRDLGGYSGRGDAIGHF